MKKYIISMPDASMRGIKLSGVNSDKNPFKVLGEILLQIDRGGLTRYTVLKTDFDICFPKGEKFWQISHMFCTGMNSNIIIYHESSWLKQEFIDISYHIGNGDFPVFSKHKVDDNKWKVIIYSQDNDILLEKVQEFFNTRVDKVEFKF